MSESVAPAPKSLSTRMVQAAALVVIFGLVLLATRTAPSSRPVVDTIAGLGFLLLAGTLTSELLERFGIPHLTGYLLAGVLAGPNVFALIDGGTIGRLGPVNSLALSLIALAGGAELHVELVKRVWRSLAWATALQHTLVPLASIAAFLLLARFTPFATLGVGELIGVALLWGAVAATRSPAALLGIIAQLRPKGPLTTFSIAFVMVSDLVCILMVSLAIAFARPLLDATSTISLHDLQKLSVELLGSVALGFSLGMVLAIYLKLIGKNRLLVLLALGTGLAELLRYIQFDALLAFLVAGFFVRNFSEQGPKLLDAVQRMGGLVFVVFFAVAGAKVDLGVLVAVGPVVLALCAVRALVSVGVARASSAIAADEGPVRTWGWSSMISQAGFTLGVTVVVARAFPQIGESFTTVSVAAVTINETIGPVLFKLGLDRAGESGQAAQPSERTPLSSS